MSPTSFAANIRFLRKRIGRSQEEVAQALGLKRTTWSAYEQGVSEPSLHTLSLIADYFRIPLDILLRETLEQWSESQIRTLELAWEERASGSRLRVVVTTADHQGRNNVELVPEKARAGYVSGYADPEFIRVLPAFHLPFLRSDRKYRTFQIAGDSMPPVAHGSYVTGEFVDNWLLIRSGTPCIVVTRQDGVVFKIVHNEIRECNRLVLSSTNPAYAPYEVHVDDVLEVWRFVHYISSELPPPNLKKDPIRKALNAVHDELRRLRWDLERERR
ncbi:MAG: LexA family transcriptional regulator [Flavobacteriales bacterium]|nr:LexA family transcriptional regulator [Flavobacteriales bacterium]MCX7768339.1 LexA family transcriptional regulator [Flavobacteriales bacterium]MDW8409101.1 LexA family transcriptional regulator [Flavobacteriales bacterium]